MPKIETDFSESSFAFAFTDNLLRDRKFTAYGAPRFLSTYAEGKGEHFDVELPGHPVAFFFQFKIPEVMQRKRWLKAGGRLDVPFYRMNLRQDKLFAQHHGLLACETAGKNVYYACPRFHTNLELDRLFSRGEIHHHSAWFRPSKVTPPEYNSPHGVAYDLTGKKAEIRSEHPRTHEGSFDFATFARVWTAAVEGASKQESGKFFTDLVHTLRSAEEKAFGELRALQAELAKELRLSHEDYLFADNEAVGPSPILGLPAPRQSEAMQALSLARSLFGLEILVGGHD